MVDLTQIIQQGKQSKIAVYLVGGIVRDIFLDKTPSFKDIDITVEGDAIKFAEAANTYLKGKLIKFPNFCTAKIKNPAGCSAVDEIDFASCRTESYEKPGMLPKVTFVDIHSDLKRRDFTVNALACKLEDFASVQKKDRSKVIDLFHGFKDLENKKLEVLHEKSFIDDPTRIFRGIRYQSRFGFNFGDKTENLLNNALKQKVIKTLSLPRWFAEVRKGFDDEIFPKLFNILQNRLILKDLYLTPKLRVSDLFEDILEYYHLNSTEKNLPIFIAEKLNQDEAKTFLNCIGISYKALSQKTF